MKSTPFFKSFGLVCITAFALSACSEDPTPTKKSTPTEEMGADMSKTIDMPSDPTDQAQDNDQGADMRVTPNDDMRSDMPEEDMAKQDDMATRDDMGEDMAQDMAPPAPAEVELFPSELNIDGSFGAWSSRDLYGSTTWNAYPADVSRYQGSTHWVIGVSANGNSYGETSVPFISDFMPGDVVRVQVEVFTLSNNEAPLFAGMFLSNDLGEAAAAWTSTLTLNDSVILEAQLKVEPWDVSNLYFLGFSAQFGAPNPATGIGSIAFGRPRLFVTRGGATAQVAPAPVNLDMETPALPPGGFRYSAYGWSGAGNLSYAGIARHSSTLMPQGAAQGDQVLELSFPLNTDNSTVMSGAPVSVGRQELLANPNRMRGQMTSAPVLTIDESKAYRVSAQLSNRADLPNDQAIRVGLTVDGDDFNAAVPELSGSWTTVTHCYQPRQGDGGKPLSVLISGERIAGGSSHRVLVDDVKVETLAACP